MGALPSQLILALLTVGISPVEDVPRERVDLIEVNHFHDELGRLVFDQVIFYEWSPEAGRHQVRAWRLLKNASQRPRKDFVSGDYVATWHDGDLYRQVRSPAIRESWTQYDPELVEREFLPKERRVELVKVTPAAIKRKKPTPEGVSGEVARSP